MTKSELLEVYKLKFRHMQDLEKACADTPKISLRDYLAPINKALDKWEQGTL